jgi:plastocyanin
VIATLAATLALLAGPTAGTPPATAVGMSAREYSFGVYRTRVPAGRVKLNIHNYGEDVHDLQVRGPNGYRSAVSPEIAPGETLTFRVRLRRPGRYLLICRIPGHAAKGMKAHLTVRRRAAGRGSR